MSLKGIAKDTLEILEAGHFMTPSGARVDFSSELETAVANTVLFTPEQLDTLLDDRERDGSPPHVEVTGETTQVAAHRLVVDDGVDDLVLLNFASARNPGGGFVNGAKAQEEDLARCSGLYPCLLTQPHYYVANREQESLLYTDHIIYSPSVPWFRTRSTNLLDHFFLASVITAPAPNAGEVLNRDVNAEDEIESCLRRRAAKVLAVARHGGHRNLLLGAWGCGVFRNKPALVADAFGSQFDAPSFAAAFDKVTFAVYDRSKTANTLRAFRDRFSYSSSLDARPREDG